VKYLRDKFQNCAYGHTDILGVYCKPKHDPKGHRPSVVFEDKLVSGDAQSGGNAESLEWLPVDNGTPLVFDHPKILQDYHNGKFIKVPTGHQSKVT
jgi:ADP-ribose pyrophosphatase YjhB (NUDIX family)